MLKSSYTSLMGSNWIQSGFLGGEVHREIDDGLMLS